MPTFFARTSALVLALLPAACSPDVPESLAQGKVLLKNRDYEAALKMFDRVLSVEPRHVEARKSKGEILLNTARYDEAAEVLAPLHTELPKFVDATWLLAMVRHMQGQHAEALPLFEAIPDAQRPPIPMAETLTGVGRHDDAANTIAFVLSHDPFVDQAYLVLSKIEARRGREAQAKLWGDHYRAMEPMREAENNARRLDLAGQPFRARMTRAASLRERGRWYAAMTSLQEVIDHDPAAIPVLMEMAGIMVDLRGFSVARGFFDRVLEHQPDHPAATKARDAAVAALAAAGGKDPMPVDVARDYARQDDMDRARAAALYAARQPRTDALDSAYHVRAMRAVVSTFDREQDAFVRLWAWKQACDLEPANASFKAALKAQADQLKVAL